MPRLLFLVEGETEETFVNEILAEELQRAGFESVGARLVGNARMRTRRGGIRHWPEVERDILRHLRQDRGVYITTMVDYYGLPARAGDPRSWPGRAAASALPFAAKAAHVEDSLSARIAEICEPSIDSRRFIPYVEMHEFEALLFSDCAGFAAGIGKPELARAFQEIRDLFASPEEINDSAATHPSRRVRDLVPEYQKPLYGTLAALEIGLSAIRSACPHFHDWLGRLVRVMEQK